ncbi:MAG: cytochrome ubiquinol oxidase subunit I, partial [Bifidobacteriales bacterium]|nr:cytochrome ubiquinol oxidase subunit I [Bifidobacteriales bacterium]
ASNSWMQTPQGYIIDPKTGHFLPKDWLAIIFNPSFPYRIIHMGLAAMLSVAFTVAAAGAWHLLKAKKNKTQADSTVRLMFSLSLWMIVATAPLQILAGDMHGLNTLKYQPAKIAAIEGDWISERRAPELLFGIPNMKTEHTDYAISVPLLGSLILTHDINGKVPGLKDYPADQRAPSPIVFFSFRIMVALGGIMLLCGLWSLWLRHRGRFFTHPLFLRVMLIMAPAGFVALLCGWVTTEVGRQPWTVYGLLRTEDSASPLALSSLSFSMLFFVVIYVFVFGSGLLMLVRLLRTAPEATDNTHDDTMILGSHHHTVSHNKEVP